MIHIGTSGWTYDDWSGPFYPDDVRGAERLAFYAERFDTVEVNASFYRVPTPSMIAAWNARLPRGCRLVVKGNRAITHRRKLAGCDEPLPFFFERALQLKRLRVVLWQLPPILHKDVARLDRFLGTLPRKVRHAVEFRHDSWWDDDVAAVLARHRAAFVAISHSTLPDKVVPTADFLYVRFHGRGEQAYDYDYSKRELRAWAERLRRPLAAGRELYAFFNNDHHANAPRNALAFKALLTPPAAEELPNSRLF